MYIVLLYATLSHRHARNNILSVYIQAYADQVYIRLTATRYAGKNILKVLHVQCLGYF